jgi:HSP20 family protein
MCEYYDFHVWKGADNTMKPEAITPAKHIAIQQVGIDSLFKEMAEWSNRIAKRAYEFFANSGFTNGHDLDHWLKAEEELLKPVMLDVKDSKDEFCVTAEVPGFEAKDLQVHLNGSHLAIEGKHETSEERKEKEGKATYSERKSRQIYRTIELPAPVRAEHAQAQLKNGILELKLPKAVKPKQIKVAAA